MKIEEVIELGKKINTSQYINPDPSIWAYIACIIAVGLALLALRILMSDDAPLAILAMLLALICLIGGMTDFFIIGDSQNKEVDKWKTKVVTPFVESLPVEKREVVYIKMESKQTSQNEKIDKITYTSPSNTTLVTISYKELNKEIKSITSEVNLVLDLEDKDKPYVKYRQVKKDLGHGMDAGIYNMEVHLPENYKFTEIK